MLSCPQRGTDKLFSCRSSLGCPGGQSLWGPLAGLAMGLRHVSGDGAMPTLLIRTPVAGDPVAPVEAFDGVVGDPDLHLFLDQ